MSRTHDLVDATIMGNETTMHALFDELRNETPLAYFDHPDYEPFWVLTRHEDIKYVSMHNDLFINNPRTVIMPREFEQMLLEQFGTRNGLETLIHMDNPKHRKLRGVTREWFKPTP
ncbi:MAG: cytochrome P450, partial [Pseudomonadota bacterium]